MLSYQIVFFLRDMTDLTHNKNIFSLKHIKTNLLLNEISIQPTYFTWLSDNDPTSINRLDGYDSFACANRVNTPGGGVGASSKNDFNLYRFLLAVELMNLIIKMFNWKEDIFFLKTFTSEKLIYGANLSNHRDVLDYINVLNVFCLWFLNFWIHIVSNLLIVHIFASEKFFVKTLGCTVSDQFGFLSTLENENNVHRFWDFNYE